MTKQLKFVKFSYSSVIRITVRHYAFTLVCESLSTSSQNNKIVTVRHQAPLAVAFCSFENDAPHATVQSLMSGGLSSPDLHSVRLRTGSCSMSWQDERCSTTRLSVNLLSAKVIFRDHCSSPCMQTVPVFFTFYRLQNTIAHSNNPSFGKYRCICQQKIDVCNNPETYRVGEAQVEQADLTVRLLRLAFIDILRTYFGIEEIRHYFQGLFVLCKHCHANGDILLQAGQFTF